MHSAYFLGICRIHRAEKVIHMPALPGGWCTGGTARAHIRDRAPTATKTAPEQQASTATYQTAGGAGGGWQGQSSHLTKREK